MKCNPTSLKEKIEAFRQFGKTAKNGVSRLSLSLEDLQARAYFKKRCEELQMTVTIDDLGNMYALKMGKNPDLKPIVIGSHLDSVLNGGAYDGVLGVIAGLQVVETLREENIDLEHPLLIVNFTNEEGARFDPAMMCSGILAGKFSEEKMLKVRDEEGTTFEQALNNGGMRGEKEHRLREGVGYFELHIEQGPVLDKEQIEIGVVEGVVGMVCYEINIFGQANHAGTTPMIYRQDALLEAARLMIDLEDQLLFLPEDLVFTFGRIYNAPNIHTVVPGHVRFTLEAIHKDEKVLKDVREIIKRTLDKSCKCKRTYEELWSRETVYFNSDLICTVENSAKALKKSYKKMYSGAGHDAQFIASLIPSVMIFIPSLDGISHNEAEYSSLQQCLDGVNVLLNAVYQFDCKKKSAKSDS